MRNLILCIINLILVIILFSGLVLAQEYKIGSEDVLSISFWQQPQLNTNARVNQDGTIVMPVIGSIMAAGLTPAELTNKIVAKISLFNRNISQASVVVTQYGSKKVYVNGHVRQPGKYSFEVIPDLWKIILEAGGPAETAKLDQVKIIRSGQESGKILIVDLTEFLGEGNLSKLPPIYPDDTIQVPGVNSRTAGAESAAPGGITSTQVNEDVIYIYGQVARPGGYQFTRNLSLLEAIIIAGGPTRVAKMDEVKIIMKGDRYSSIATINLESYSKHGTPAPFLLNPGDTVFIPEKKASAIGETLQRGILYEVLRVALTVGSSILIYALVR
jgi:polysaccharide export outer membrane protein